MFQERFDEQCQRIRTLESRVYSLHNILRTRQQTQGDAVQDPPPQLPTPPLDQPLRIHDTLPVHQQQQLLQQQSLQPQLLQLLPNHPQSAPPDCHLHKSDSSSHALSSSSPSQSVASDMPLHPQLPSSMSLSFGMDDVFDALASSVRYQSL